MFKDINLRFFLVLFALAFMGYSINTAGITGIEPSVFPGRILGYVGAFYILFFLYLYSTRKRLRKMEGGLLKNFMKYHIMAVGWYYFGDYIKRMKVKELLELHILTAVLGSLMILLHTSLSFDGISGIAARIMSIVVISGLTGRFIVKQVRKMRDLLNQLEEEHKETTEIRVVRMGVQSGEKFLSAWRNMHIPLTNIFYVTVIFHFISTFYY